jgi:hypothetical protein
MSGTDNLTEPYCAITRFAPDKPQMDCDQLHSQAFLPALQD